LIDAGNRSVPAQFDAGEFRGPDQQFVKHGTTETEAMAIREIRLHGAGFAAEANAAEGIAAGIRYVEADSRGRFTGIGQQTFAACFVNRRMIAIGNHHAHAFSAKREGCGEASRTAADYKDIGLAHQLNYAG
jgi:hypothetical protein